MKIKLVENDNNSTDLDDWMFGIQFPHYNGPSESNGYRYVFHNTSNDNLPNIYEKGLKIGLNSGGYSDKSEEGIWFTNEPQKGYGGATVTFKIPIEEYNEALVNDSQGMLYREVSPDDILFLDPKLIGIEGKVSDIPDLVKEYGEEKVGATLSKHMDTKVVVGILGRAREMNLIENEDSGEGTQVSDIEKVEDYVGDRKSKRIHINGEEGDSVC